MLSWAAEPSRAIYRLEPSTSNISRGLMKVIVIVIVQIIDDVLVALVAAL
jgi:hypothetical protein